MPDTQVDTSYEYDVSRANWLFDPAGHPCPITARSRRRVTIDAFGQRVTVKRRYLESHGCATSADGRVFSVRTYEGKRS
jgi:hypothetical protein